MKSPAYRIIITLSDGHALLRHRGRTHWTKRTALKHLRDWTSNFPYMPARMEAE